VKHTINANKQSVESALNTSSSFILIPPPYSDPSFADGQIQGVILGQNIDVYTCSIIFAGFDKKLIRLQHPAAPITRRGKLFKAGERFRQALAGQEESATVVTRSLHSRHTVHVAFVAFSGRAGATGLRSPRDPGDSIALGQGAAGHRWGR
jgi:hypothetical protein